MQKVSKLWLDGEFVDWEKGQVHVLTHSLHYGLGVFEGIRAYQRADGRTQIFRLKEHISRLFDGAKITTINIPFSPEELERACIDLIKLNKMSSGYMRPIAFVGDGAMGLHAMNNETRVAIVAWPWGSYLGEDGLKNGIHAKISSFTRHHVNVGMVKGKITGQYVNSILAKRGALADGYDEALLLDPQGYVCEASGENIFMVDDGMLMTPPRGASILDGITRQSIIIMAKERGIEVREERLTRDMLYTADEVFLTGTAAEVTPVRMIDHRPVGTGKPGPITKQLQDYYFDLVRGSAPEHDEWRCYID